MRCRSWQGAAASARIVLAFPQEGQDTATIGIATSLLKLKAAFRTTRVCGSKRRRVGGPAVSLVAGTPQLKIRMRVNAAQEGTARTFRVTGVRVYGANRREQSVVTAMPEGVPPGTPANGEPVNSVRLPAVKKDVPLEPWTPPSLLR